jgi:hypothetical protein
MSPATTTGELNLNGFHFHLEGSRVDFPAPGGIGHTGLTALPPARLNANDLRFQ